MENQDPYRFTSVIGLTPVLLNLWFDPRSHCRRCACCTHTFVESQTTTGKWCRGPCCELLAVQEVASSIFETLHERTLSLIALAIHLHGSGVAHIDCGGMNECRKQPSAARTDALLSRHPKFAAAVCPSQFIHFKEHAEDIVNHELTSSIAEFHLFQALLAWLPQCP